MIELDGNVLVETEHLGSNNSIVCTRDGVVLIDAPHRPTDAMRWRRKAEACGQVEFLLHTDHHIDHTMGNAFLGGRIVAHEMTRERLMNAAPTRQYIDDLLDVIDPAGKVYLDGYAVRLPTVTFTDKLTLHVGGLDFVMTHLPGHTLNSTLIYVPQQKIAFTGDLVCSAGLPAFIEADTFAWVEAVRQIEQMDIRYLIPGHGPVCGLAEARLFRRWMEDLIGEVEGRIDRGHSRSEIAEQVAYEDRIHIATGESPAYPDHLISLFMTRSIETIYDHIQKKRGATAR
jgi:glyoxylase-like metal-dependent hydrolase (beta-lactamase superfamily II)